MMFLDKPEIPQEQRFSTKRYESGLTRYRPFGLRYFLNPANISGHMIRKDKHR